MGAITGIPTQAEAEQAGACGSAETPSIIAASSDPYARTAPRRQYCIRPAPRSPTLAKLARDVGSRALVIGAVEDLARLPDLDQSPRSRLGVHVHERGVVGHPRRLLQVVGHDHDRD